MGIRDDVPDTGRRWPAARPAEAPRAWPVKASGVLEKEERLLVEQLGEGDAALDRGDAEGAAASYAHAIEHLRGASSGVQAEAYVRLGRANRLRGRTMACVHCLKKALSLVPGHLAALEELVALHAEWNEWDAVEAVETDLFAALPNGPRRLRELLRSGDRWWRRAGNPARARERYGAALHIDGESEPTRARLRALAASERRTEELRELRLSAERSTDPARRARCWLELGQAYWFEVRRFGDAITAFENAFDADPTLLEAMEVLVAALVDRQQWGRLEKWWRKLADAQSPAELAARNTIREALRHLPQSTVRATKGSTLPWFDRDPVP